MTNFHQLQQVLRTMQTSRSALAHDLTRDVRETGSRSPFWTPLLKRFGVPVAIALGTVAILRKGRTRR
jgi:hypothetical protein